jgi:hypothetical protein
MVRVPDQVLCELLRSPKGFIPSVLNANLTFLASFSNFENLALKRFHYLPSEVCHSLHHPSYIQLMHART